MDPAITIAVASASGLGASVVTLVGRVLLERLRSRQAERKIEQEQRALGEEVTGKVLIARMDTDERTRRQLSEWMKEERARAERAERQVEQLRREYWELHREHDQLRGKLERMERAINALRRKLPDEYAQHLPAPSSYPPSQGQAK